MQTSTARSSADVDRCILGEMYHREPILAAKGQTDDGQLPLILEHCGPLNDDTFPGWQDLPGYPGHARDEVGFGFCRSVHHGQGQRVEVSDILVSPLLSPGPWTVAAYPPPSIPTSDGGYLLRSM